MIGKVTVRRHVVKTGRTEQCRHCFTLIKAMLDNEHATGPEMLRCALCEPAIAFEAVHRIGQRNGRLKAQIAL